MCSSALVVRRAAFDIAGPMPDLAVGEFIAWYGLAQTAGLTSFVVPNVLVRRRIHLTNMSRRPSADKSGYLKAAKMVLLRLSPAETVLTNRPNLLFLTPMQPNRSGSGSAIRAAATLEALARHFNVYVLCVPLFTPDPVSAQTEFVTRLAAGYCCYAPPAGGEFPVQQVVAEHFPGVEFAAIHTFRLVLARAALAMRAGCFSVLDLDDDEMQRCERNLELREAMGDVAAAQLERDTVPRLRLMERMLLPRFSAVTMASELACEGLRRRSPGVTIEVHPQCGVPAAGNRGGIRAAPADTAVRRHAGLSAE